VDALQARFDALRSRDAAAYAQAGALGPLRRPGRASAFAA
jgi:hypothetical protein